MRKRNLKKSKLLFCAQTHISLLCIFPKTFCLHFFISFCRYRVHDLEFDETYACFASKILLNIWISVIIIITIIQTEHILSTLIWIMLWYMVCILSLTTNFFALKHVPIRIFRNVQSILSIFFSFSYFDQTIQNSWNIYLKCLLFQ